MAVLPWIFAPVADGLLPLLEALAAASTAETSRTAGLDVQMVATAADDVLADADRRAGGKGGAGGTGGEKWHSMPSTRRYQSLRPPCQSWRSLTVGSRVPQSAQSLPSAQT